MVIAVHFEGRTPIPFLKRRAGYDANQMPVFVVLFAVVDVLEVGRAQSNGFYLDR